MKTKINLQREYFSELPTEIMSSSEFSVKLFRYPAGVEAVEIKNSRGKIIVLPYMGQIIWRAEFDGIDLTMKNMFSQPRKTHNMLDTYGCFAFHSGLLASGCPSPEDTHPMHGEFCCADIDRAWLEIEPGSITLCGEYEYCQGFGYRYTARPSVQLKAGAGNITIGMNVKNTTSIPMPLQYICHINYAYVDEGEFAANIPDSAFKLRETIPSHIKPTADWFAYTDEIKKMQSQGKTLTKLGNPALYNTEIVFLADDIDEYTDSIEAQITSPQGYTFKTQFSTQQFKHAIRWIMYNGDQQVSSFIIPATSRPEGFLAAQKAGHLIMLEPNETREFSVTTGLK